MKKLLITLILALGTSLITTSSFAANEQATEPGTTTSESATKVRDNHEYVYKSVSESGFTEWIMVIYEWEWDGIVTMFYWSDLDDTRDELILDDVSFMEGFWNGKVIFPDYSTYEFDCTEKMLQLVTTDFMQNFYYAYDND